MMDLFESKMKRLEEIVERLEEREIPLGESLSLFEEGVALVRELDGILQGAEGKIRMLMEDLRLKELPRDEIEKGDEGDESR
jgi:exodeoxyribonuclease VII small subunit